MSNRERPTGNLAALLCALSFATSLGLSERMEHGLNSAYIGLRLADVLKLLTKEIITPAEVDRTLHFLAPMIVLGPALMTWAVIPFGPGLQVTDLNIGILYLLAFGAIPALGVTLAGWGSMNKYSLLGGMRAVVRTCANLDLKLKVIGSGLATRQMPAPGARIKPGEICQVEFQ